MGFIERIKEVIESGVLLEDLMTIPLAGATDMMIDEEENVLPRPLSKYHRAFLQSWNGADMDKIRVHGVGKTEEFIKPLSREHQEWDEIIDEVARKLENKVILFADDPAGFMYFELENGPIIQLDTDGGATEVIAENMSDFFLNYLFGKRANEYAGDDWLQELIDAKIVS